MIHPLETLPPVSELTPLETLLLLSADESGWIPFQDGNYKQVSAFLDALTLLQKKHHVQRRPRNGYFAYRLTKSGEALKSQMIASRMKGTN